MKVLMIAPQPFLEPRGTPISVYQRLHSLSQLGHSIDLLTYHLGENVTLPSVKIYRTLNLPFIKQLRVGPSWAKLPLDFLLFLKAVGLLIRKKYDVIHSHEEAAFFAMVLAWLFRTAHIYDMHSSLPQQLVNFRFGATWPIIRVFEIFEHRVIKSCDAMITIGPDLAQLAETIYPGVRQVMIENLPIRASQSEDHRVSLKELKNMYDLHGKTLIVYTGTFERYQGVDLLIDSIKALKGQSLSFALILVGGKSEQVAQLKAKAEQIKVAENIVFTGTVSLEEADQFIQIADVLVSPRVEGTSVPLKIYTYLDSGKPILATKIPAHTLVLNSMTAMLVEPSADSIAEGLVELVKDADLRNRLGRAARALCEEKYNPSLYLGKLEQIYHTLQYRRSATAEDKLL